MLGSQRVSETTQIYACERDDFTDEQAEEEITRALELARLLGDKSAQPPAASGVDRKWYFADTAKENFGERVDESILSSAIVRGTLAILSLEGEPPDYVFIEKVSDGDLESWKESKRSGPGRDLRLAGLKRDSQGKRRALLREMRNLFRSTKFDDWPFRGPKALEEMLDALISGGVELFQAAAGFLRDSGLSAKSAIAHELRHLFCTLHLLCCYDQLDLSNSAGAEYLARRILCIQRAVRRSPTAPDFSGQEHFMSSAFDENGGIIVSNFEKHVAEEERAKAQVLKQNRLWHEEQSHAEKAAKGGKDKR